MNEYINRWDALRALDEYMNSIHIITTADIMAKSEITRCKQVVNGVPAADVVEREKGKWKLSPDDSEGACTICNYKIYGKKYHGRYLIVPYNFCPNCGSEMVGCYYG